MHDYQLTGDRAARLAEIDASADLAGEMKLARLAAEEMANAGNLSAAAAMCAVVGRLSTAKVQNDIHTAKTLPYSSVVSIARAIIDSINLRLDGLPNQAAIIEGIMQDVSLLFTRVRAEQRLLTSTQLRKET
jgi:hypothetical protein